MNKKNPQIDEYMDKATTWKAEQQLLRSILLDSELVEEMKWKQPCYVYNDKNVIMIGSFKNFAIISFLKGVLIKDKEHVLVKQGENTQASRIIKFTSVKEIEDMVQTLKLYIAEAIEIEKLGLKVEYAKPKELEYIEELQSFLDEDTDLRNAFEALTPGRKRAYNMFFNDAKQSKTRISRIEKYIPKILAGKGLNDWK